jgi:NAD(P)-dependent dehydrogenase (short-subunit alcohol dehydrogenase family)
MKSVLITGANRGIGYGLVKQLLANKAEHLFATYRQADRSKVGDLLLLPYQQPSFVHFRVQELLDLAKEHPSKVIALQLGWSLLSNEKGKAT